MNTPSTTLSRPISFEYSVREDGQKLLFAHYEGDTEQVLNPEDILSAEELIAEMTHETTLN
jgi:hypothetical protein